MKGNTATIIKKEFARFFGDRQLLFSAVVLPGLLIYIIYSLMGSGINRMISEGAGEVVVVQVENCPASLAPALMAMDSNVVLVEQPFAQKDIDSLANKDINAVLLRFPADFDSRMAGGGAAAPNVELYYNSTNNASARVYAGVSAMLNRIYTPFTLNEPQWENQRFDQASDEAIGAMVWSKLLPMLIVMMLFSGVMSIAPSSIAGEKERGTIATLLVTPMKREELALGKIVSLSCMAMLSGVSSFIGIALSLPKMISAEGMSGLGLHYEAGDYVVLLVVIFATVLIMASMVSLLSALAKDVKNAGTMVMPLMLLLMLAGLLPMFQSGVADQRAVYLIPFYNSIEVMTAVFAHDVAWEPVLITVGANVVYTAVAVWGLTKMFGSEKVMFSR